MATRKKKASSEGGASADAKKLTRAELKQQDAGTHSAKAKVHEFNEQLHVWRRKLRKAARQKQA